MQPKKARTAQFYLDIKTIAKLKKLASKKGLSMSSTVRLLISEAK